MATFSSLNQFPLVLHICVSELGQRWFRQWLVAYTAPSHCLNQLCNIVNWILVNSIPWNINRNTKRFIHKNIFENVVWKMSAILSQLQCVNTKTYSLKACKCYSRPTRKPINLSLPYDTSLCKRFLSQLSLAAFVRLSSSMTLDKFLCIDTGHQLQGTGITVYLCSDRTHSLDRDGLNCNNWFYS